MTGNHLKYDNLKLYIIQVESIRLQTATAPATDNKSANLSQWRKFGVLNATVMDICSEQSSLKAMLRMQTVLRPHRRQLPPATAATE